MQSFELTKSMNFGSSLKKLFKNHKKFHINIDEKIFFKLEIGLTLIDPTQIFLMKPSELKISFSVESCKSSIETFENFRNWYDAENRSFETNKDINPKF